MSNRNHSLSAWMFPIALAALTACDAWFMNSPDSRGTADGGATGGDTLSTPAPKPVTKASLAGCWHEVGNPALGSLIDYPLTDLHCVDLCLSLATNRFDQVVYTRESVTYKKHYDIFGLEWTETESGKSIEAYGTYSLGNDTLRRSFTYPDPPANDTAEIWKLKIAIAFNPAGDTLLAAGHRFIRPDGSRHCGTLWKTFDPDPDPPSGGGGGGWDWD